MAVLKLSQITAASSGFITGDQIVSVKSGNIDALFSKAQLFTAPITVTDIADPATSTLTLNGAIALTTSQPVLNMTQTWNAAGTTFNGLKFVITDTASATASLAVNILGGAAGATSLFTLGKAGNIIIPSGTAGTPAIGLGGTGCGIYTRTTATVDIASGGNPIAEFQPSFVTLVAGTTIGWGAIGVSFATAISNPSTAVLQLGLADAAAPVAQTLQVQSVVAGSSNVAGADWTLVGSKGTGTGAGGAIIFKTAPAGTTGTSQNAAVESYRVVSNGAIQLFNTSGLRLYFDTTFNGIGQSAGGLTLQRGGADYACIRNGVSVRSNVGYAWSSAVDTTSVEDLFIWRGGPATLQFGREDVAAPVAQTMQVASVVAGTSNVAGVDWTIKGSKGTGTGAGGKIIFQVAPCSSGTGATAQNPVQTGLSITASSVATFTQQPSVVIGSSQLNSSAVEGFLYIPTVSGPPTGAPTTYTGRVPLVFDSSNNKLYIYNSSGAAWVGGTAPGAWS